MQVNEKVELARASGAGVLLTLWGLTLADWAAALTIVYLLWQIIVLTPKVFAVIGNAIRSLKKHTERK